MNHFLDNVLKIVEEAWRYSNTQPPMAQCSAVQLYIGVTRVRRCIVTPLVHVHE